MKKFLLLLFLPTTISSGHNPNLNIGELRPIVEDVVVLTPQPISMPEPINELVNALIYVESRGVDSAIGDVSLGEPSIGVLQIRPIMVREVNRILKKQKSSKRFSLKDRFSREKSIEMFMVWKNYHHPEGGFETIARNWNGGPRGYKNKRTEKYWIKVQKQLKLNKLS
jgi:hypothetical protein